MIRAIFFMIKIAVLAVIAVWIADQEGSVSFTWVDPQGAENIINIHLGMFFVGAMGVILLALVLFRLIKGFADSPKVWGRYKREKDKEKGFRALTLGLTAVAAGDTKAARYQAHRAGKLLSGDEGLTRLLLAQSARLEGKEEEANEHFIHLLENKDASFLGMRGLLQSALDAEDYDSALNVAREAAKLHPKQPWILKIVYDLEIKARELDAALKTLYRAEKYGAISKEKAAGDRIAMLLYEADRDVDAGARDMARKKLEKAYKYNETYIPTVLRLSRYYLQNGKRKKAIGLIEKAWRVNTHPDLVPLWASAAPKASKKNQSSAQLKWFERLLDINKGSAEGHLAVAKVAMENSLWGEARNYLKTAEGIRTSKTLYRLYALLEEKTGGDPESVQDWLQRAADAPSERTWICRETGRMYDKWSAYAEPHGSFDTIVWDFPFTNDNTLVLSHAEKASEPQPVLEAPRV